MLLVCPPANSSVVSIVQRHSVHKMILATRQDASEADSASNSARSADDLMLMKDDTRVDDMMLC